MTTKRPELTIYRPPSRSRGLAPLVGERVQAGFPSPAENYVEEQLDLNQYCVKNPPATFFVRVEGDSMINAGIGKGDLLVVDRSLRAGNNDIVVAVLNGDFTLKRLIIKNGKYYLQPENPNHSRVEIREGMEFEVWGRVTRIIHAL